MLPVVAATARRRGRSSLYTVLLLAATVVPFAVAGFGVVYLAARSRSAERSSGSPCGSPRDDAARRGAALPLLAAYLALLFVFAAVDLSL